MIALLVCTLRVLLCTSCVFPALRVIAFAVVFIRSPVKLCGMFVKFSGFVVIAVCHRGSWVQPSGRTNRPDANPFPEVTEWCDRNCK